MKQRAPNPDAGFVVLDGDQLRHCEPQWPPRCAACGKACAEHATIAAVSDSSRTFSELEPTRKFCLPMHASCRRRFRIHWYAAKFAGFLVPVALVLTAVALFFFVHKPQWSRAELYAVFVPALLVAALAAAAFGIWTRPAVYIEEVPRTYNGKSYRYVFRFRDKRYGAEFMQLNGDLLADCAGERRSASGKPDAP